MGRNTLPFNVDVTHLLASDACFIQNDISCVPNNGPQDIPVSNTLRYIGVPTINPVKQLLLWQRVSLLGFTWRDVTRGPWQTEALRENVYPHLNPSLYLH